MFLHQIECHFKGERYGIIAFHMYRDSVFSDLKNQGNTSAQKAYDTTATPATPIAP